MMIVLGTWCCSRLRDKPCSLLHCYLGKRVLIIIRRRGYIVCKMIGEGTTTTGGLTVPTPWYPGCRVVHR